MRCRNCPCTAAAVDHAEPVFIRRLAVLPNDPQLYNASALWHLQHIYAPAAWDRSSGSKAVSTGGRLEVGGEQYRGGERLSS